jgi:hypothetical protein
MMLAGMTDCHNVHHILDTHGWQEPGIAVARPDIWRSMMGDLGAFAVLRVFALERDLRW